MTMPEYDLSESAIFSVLFGKKVSGLCKNA